MSRKCIGLIVLALVLGLAQASPAAWDPNTDPALIGWWKFDDGAGNTAQDSSGKAHHGTLQGSPQWAAGYFDGALAFRGSDYVEISYAADLALNEFTVSAWVNVAVEPGVFGVHGTRVGGEYTFDFKVQAANIHGDVGTGSAWLNTTLDIGATDTGTKGQGGDLELGTWYMIAYVIDNTKQQVRLYLDGDLKRTIGISGKPLLMQTGQSMQIGATGYPGEGMNGLIDDVRIYSRALTTAEIKALVPPKVKARKPSPADGAPDVMMPLFGWVPGELSIFENVYLGTTPELTEADRVSTRQLALMKFYYHMSPPLFPLAPGQKYYWRIDGIDAAGKVYKGDVWSFTIYPLKASLPNPANNATGVFPELTLSWLKGKDGKSNHVYFGADQTAVTNGDASTDKGTADAASFTTVTLRSASTYYWRVDTVNYDGTVLQGDVWSFTSAEPGPANKITFEAWMNIGGTAISALTGNARYPNSPDTVEYLDTWLHPAGAAPDADWDDNYGTRMYGWLKPPQTGDYTFWIAGDDEQQLWLSTDESMANAVTIASMSGWTPALDFDNTGGGQAGGPNMKSAPIALQTGKKYFIMALGKEGGGGDSTAVAWQGGPIATREVIKGEYLDTFSLPPLQAFAPSPANGAVDTVQTLTLTWGAGEKAQQHAVYFGDDAAAVGSADTSSALFKGQQAGTSFDTGALEFGKTYYWRVDEIAAGEAGSPWKGRVWSFTTASFLPIDDFESYTNDSPNRVFQTWIDGWGFSADEFFPTDNLGNGSASAVGHDIWTAGTPYTTIIETSIVHPGGSKQSMPFDYNNIADPYHSETDRTWTTVQNWTLNDVNTLSLWVRGNAPRFVEDPAGTYTMSSTSGDVYYATDHFRFAYKRLNGDGSIVAKINSQSNSHVWAKAGVMIRNTLDAGSMHTLMMVTPTGRRAFQNRRATDGPSFSAHSATGAITLPFWVKIERKGNDFTAYYSQDGKTWTKQPDTENTGTDASKNPETINMAANIYVGLAVTSNNTGVACIAQFSDVTTTGSVSGQWQVADIGGANVGNDPAQLYVAIQDGAGKVAVVNHPDLNVVLATTWTEWQIPLTQFTGANAKAVKKMFIGVGDRNAPAAGGVGRLYFDDIRVIKPAPAGQ